MTTPTKEGLKMFEGAGTSHGVTAECVVTSSNSIELPLLTKANYHEWSLVMQVSLEALELWDAVEAECKERAKDRWALAAILRAVPSEMKADLAMKKSAKEAPDAVKSMCIGDDRVKAASTQRLWKEFENFRFRDGECVDDALVRINGLVASLQEMGEMLEDHRVVKKLLRVVPRKFKQVAVAIEMLTDLKMATIEEFVGHLRVAEDTKAVVQEDVGRLYLTKEQWEACHRQRNKERARGNDARCGGNDGDARGGNGGDGQRSSDNKGDGDSDVDDDTSSVALGTSRRGWSRNRGRCFECGNRGHIARFCRERKKEEETALLTDASEAPALL
ncbi:hypothetical protein U9M48_004007 [Paspalum notatum var. saurae]|uniref:CCHC-type domain-containing protein n=1 Tax=Paspalum notatum var. saurae TaxID=547442 RepID=A0AAQ3PUP8_PASNO